MNEICLSGFTTCFAFIPHTLGLYWVVNILIIEKEETMKKYVFVLSLLIFFCSFDHLFSEQVDEILARRVATTFMSRLTKNNSAVNLTLSNTVSSRGREAAILSDIKNYYYIFNLDNSGYVIVSADDNVTPILAYSTEQSFPINNIPENVSKWLEGYKSQIRYAIHKLTQTEKIKSEWQALLIENKINNPIETIGIKSVDPLVKTKWNQSPYYNDLCPDGSVTGCVATAMAQLMKYWNYPKVGNGFYSYNHDSYGRLSANFGSTTYNWSGMPNKVVSSNYEVARLMYHCGVSVDMNYGKESSGAAGAVIVAPALIKYFGYSQSLAVQNREDFSTIEWLNLLKQELISGRPMYYEGVGGKSGHAFICDGYDENNFFHFNWGWGGIADGYFKVDELNPTSVGIGSGEGTYNSQQAIVSGMQPPVDAQSYNLGMYADIEVNSNPLLYGYPFTVSTNIANNGTNLFEGDFCAALFDSENNFVDYVNTYSNQSLAGGYTYNDKLEFSSPGIVGLLPGKYSINIFYRTNGGDWKLVADADGFKNFVELRVTNTNDIELNSPIVLSPSKTFVQGRSTNVNFNITNDGKTVFRGVYKVNLYNLDGTFAEEINEYNETDGLPSGYTYQAPYITLNTSEIKSNPGTYLLAVTHKYNQNADWELTGSSYYQNPIKVNVIAQSLPADKFEPNNSTLSASNLGLSFSNNKASIRTTGSNCHNLTDYDYYKITFPLGYSYTVSPRLQDIYNSNDGYKYSLDALFSYSKDGKSWSETYDDVLDDEINVTGGETLYFLVSPFFAGKTGSYSFDIDVNRTSVSSIAENISDKSPDVYIDPKDDYLQITIEDGNIQKVNILNLQGQTIANYEVNGLNKSAVLDLKALPQGMYFIQTFTSNNIFVEKYHRIK